MFSIDGKFFKALTKIGDFIIIGIITVLCCLPVVTIGASLTAAYYVGMKLVRDEEGYVTKDFFKAFRTNFKQSFLIELFIAVLGAVLIADVNICYQWSRVDGGLPVTLLMFVSIGILLVLVAVVLYVFAILAKFDNTVRGTLKNALVLAVHHMPQTFIMLIITGGLIIISVQYPPVIIVAVPLGIYVNSFILSRIVTIYVKKAQEAAAVADAVEEFKKEAEENANAKREEENTKESDETTKVTDASEEKEVTGDAE